MNMLTRSSEWIFNPMRYAGLQRMTKLEIFQLSIAIPGQLRSVARAIYAVELLNWSASNYRPNIIELPQLTIY